MSHDASRSLTLKSGKQIHVVFSQAALIDSEIMKTQAILCLSGYGCDHYNFLSINEELGERYPLVMIDNRGMGESSYADEDYEMKDLASDAIEVADLLGFDQFHVAGISMGGFIAQELVMQADDRVKSLALLCTTSGGPDFIDLPVATEEGLRAFYALEEPLRTTSVITATVHPELPTNNKELFDAIVELRKSHPADVDQAIMQKRAVDKFLDKELALSEVKMPTLIMTGAQDRYVNPENSKTLHTKLSHSKLCMIEDADHLFFLEKPKECAQELDKFWQSI